MNVRFLEQNEISSARKLLFSVYCKTGGWQPDLDNPSDLRVANSCELIDKYDNECRWLGCFSREVENDETSETLVAVHRLHVGRSNLRFDIENYVSLPSDFKRDQTVELARLAIKPLFQRSIALFALLAFEYHWFKKNGITKFITTSTFPEPGKMYEKLGMLKHDTPPFYYSENDIEPCHLLYFEFGNSHCEKFAARYMSLYERLKSR